MRIVTWNLCGGDLKKRLDALLFLKPDIAVLQECRRPNESFSLSYLWHGIPSRKGLIIAAFGRYRLQLAEQPRNDIRFFIPARITGPRKEFNLLAVWCNPVPRSIPNYHKEFRRALGVYEPFIKSAPTLVLGDFNMWPDLSNLSERFGLVSAYHEQFREKQGNEVDLTFYPYRKRWRWIQGLYRGSQHIDYCLIPQIWVKRVKCVEIGSYRRWAKLSDHLPLIVDL